MAAHTGEGTAVEVPRLEEGSASGAEAAPDAVREVSSFECVAVLRRAGCLKGLESPTGEKGKRRVLPDCKFAHGAGELRHILDPTKRVWCPDFLGRRCHNGNACTVAHHSSELLNAEGEDKTQLCSFCKTEICQKGCALEACAWRQGATAVSWPRPQIPALQFARRSSTNTQQKDSGTERGA